MLPCRTCGFTEIRGIYDFKSGIIYLECEHCGFKLKGSLSLEKAKKDWNKLNNKGENDGS